MVSPLAMGIWIYSPRLGLLLYKCDIQADVIGWPNPLFYLLDSAWRRFESNYFTALLACHVKRKCVSRPQGLPMWYQHKQHNFLLRLIFIIWNKFLSENVFLYRLNYNCKYNTVIKSRFVENSLYSKYLELRKGWLLFPHMSFVDGYFYCICWTIYIYEVNVDLKPLSLYCWWWVGESINFGIENGVHGFNISVDILALIFLDVDIYTI